MLGKSNAPCNEETLRRLTVEQSADFNGNNWTMAYQADKIDAANTFLEALFKAQKQLGIQLKEPENWMEFNREGNERELEQVYNKYL
jgi:2-hydroxychromene-2-carboxylate isomerase